MRSSRIKNKRKKKRKKVIFLSLILVGVFFCSLIAYGEGYFYCIKTFLYKNQALEININSEKNDDLDNLNLNFKNNGTCNVYLRGFVFVYTTNNDNSGTILSNSAVKINYGNEDYWFVGDDNYVYYTKPLNAGDRTEKPMVKSIEINLSEEDKRMLSEGGFGIDIVVEAVQVNNFAYKYQWDMESIDLQDYFNKSEQMVSEEFKSNEAINLEFE